MDSRRSMGGDGTDRGTAIAARSCAGRPSAWTLPDRVHEERRTTELGALKGVTVLLVEDDPLSREALELILAYYGARVLCAETAGQALDLYEDGGLSVLVSDIGLPDLDGCALLRAIRAREGRGCHMPAIALSGYPSRETGQRARSAGYDAFLTKPVPVALLLQTIGELAPDRP
jgi:CheY-like chemotaxis protein